MIVVLGHYPAYLELGAELGATVFDVPTNVWMQMGPAEQWAANRAFLDDAISQGARFVLATPPDRVRPGSHFELELEYITLAGYRLRRHATGWEFVR